MSALSTTATLTDEALRATGARLVRTGGWTDRQAQSWGYAEGLTPAQVVQLIAGARAERTRLLTAKRWR